MSGHRFVGIGKDQDDGPATFSKMELTKQRYVAYSPRCGSKKSNTIRASTHQ